MRLPTWLRSSRDRRHQLLQRMPQGGVCAEIGVWKGEFSQRILESTQPSKLLLIDPWEFQSEFPNRWFGGKLAKSQADMDAIMDDVVARFADHPEVIIRRGYSVDVLKELEDESLDWVYIDGNHYYEYVLEDLRMSWHKVRAGGFVAGDDYTWQPGDDAPAYEFPVKEAVNDFMRERNLPEHSLWVYRSQYAISR
jgi:hypothetical protein